MTPPVLYRGVFGGYVDEREKTPAENEASNAFVEEYDRKTRSPVSRPARSAYISAELAARP